MHLNYFFLKKVSAALNEKLKGFTLETCFSQEKDELVLGLANKETEFFIKAMLTANFSTLAFPAEFHRKRQNSVNLFPELIGREVLEVVQHRGERSFYIRFAEGYLLLFKMFGNRSNLVVFKQTGSETAPLNRFHKKFPDDFLLNPLAMDRDFQVLPVDFPLTLKALQKKLPTLGDLPLAYLATADFENSSASQQQDLFAEMMVQLENPDYRIVRWENKLRLSLLPIGEDLNRYFDSLEAAHQFSIAYLSDRFFTSHFQAEEQALRTKLQAANYSLTQLEEKLHRLKTEASYSQTADIIMANLSNIPPRAAEALLYDFYQDANRLIKLKSTETPQKTAERLYRKGKNQQIEVKVLEEKALQKTEEIIATEVRLADLQQVSGVKELKQFLKNNVPVKIGKTEKSESLFREFFTDGFKILVGRSAANNDELTQRHTHKDDLWLHAKDVSGSHVVVKFQAGKPFPIPVIEKAAQLAAYYSKRKTDSLCPVIYTPKKYVRKPKGAAPGSVTVDRENVILVKPGNPFERKF